MKVLMTAFDPFGGESINPAFEAVKLLPDEIAGATIVKVEVPTVFRKALEVLNAALEREKPDIAIAIGQAGGRFDITPERVAINVDDARITDTKGTSRSMRRSMQMARALTSPPCRSRRWSLRFVRGDCPLRSRTARAPSCATT